MSARSHLALAGYAASALRRRGFGAFALAGSLTATATLVGAIFFVTSSLRADAARGSAGEPDLVVSSLVGGRPALVDATALAWLAARPGVRSVRPRVWGYAFVPALRANVTVVARDAGDAALPPRALASGRDLAPSTRGEAVVGEGLADVLKVRVGDAFSLPSADTDAPVLRIVGTFSSPVSLWTSDVAVVDEADARAILGTPPGQATDVAVELSAPEEAPLVAREIEERVRGARIVDRRLAARVRAITYGRRAGLVLAAAIPALVAMLALAWDRALGLGAAERHEIAVQKAVGWPTGDVLAARAYEAAIVATVAIALGLALAYAWVFALGAPGLGEALSGFSTTYPRTKLVPAADAAELFGLALVLAAPFVALAVVPAFRVATRDPMEVMRS